jgi:salicylate hydroxylase
VNEHIALVGDAAHAMLPFVAQGGAMAIEDAWVLAQMLTATPQVNQGACPLRDGSQTPRHARLERSGPQRQNLSPVRPARGRAQHRSEIAVGESLLSRFDWLYGWNASRT